MIQAGEHVAIFGITGSGKTTLTGKIAALFPRRILFDRLGEHAGFEKVARTYEEFVQLYREAHAQDSFTILVRPKAGLDPELLQEMVDAILQLVYNVESHTQSGIALIFEEAWLYAPLHYISPWMQEVILTGRHYNISLIANSQRPAHVNKAVISQARHVFVGQFFEYRDRKYYEDTFGKIPELNQPPAKFHFYWFRPESKPVLVSTQ